MALKQYALADEKTMINMIKDFWKDHNGEAEDDEEARADLIKWSKETSDRLYLIKEDDEVLGFAHLGSRGAGIDWLEHLYVKKDHRKKGVGSKAIELLEAIVKEYSISMYIEVAARNLEAMNIAKGKGAEYITYFCDDEEQTTVSKCGFELIDRYIGYKRYL